jgi:hypothetical protein
VGDGLPDELLARFDIVTFDPRGTAALGADTLPGPFRGPGGHRLPDLRTDEGWAAAQVLLRTRDQGC